MQVNKGKIILFALIVGFVYILPYLLFMFETGKSYHLFFATDTESEFYFYAARVREEYDGNYFSADPFIFENKTKPYLRPFLAEYLVGIFGRIARLSIDNLFIWGDFIFPVIIFFLLFYFLSMIVHSKSLSLMGAIVVLLAEIPESLTSLMRIDLPNYFLTFSRPISPQFHFIFLIVSLIFIYRSLTNAKVIDILFSGFFLGVLFYMYPYFWTYIFVSLTVLSLYLILKRQFKEVKIIFFIFIEGLGLSIPFWINHLKLVSLPFYNEMMIRVGLQASHHIIISKLSILSLVAFWFFYKKRDFNFFFLFSFLLGVPLCLNQQVFSGWIFAPELWHVYVNRQMAQLAGIALLDRLLEESRFKESLTRVFLIICLTFSISIGFIIQVHNYVAVRCKQRMPSNLYETFVWLENNAKEEDVILASDTVSQLIPIHTHNNVYWLSHISQYVNSDKDILERFFLISRILGMDEGDVISYILTHRGKGYSDFFGVRYEEPTYKRTNQKAIVKLPPDLYDYIIQRYRIFKKEDIRKQIIRFRVDYLFFGPDEQLLSKGRFKLHPFLNKVYDYGGIQIYKIIS